MGSLQQTALPAFRVAPVSSVANVDLLNRNLVDSIAQRGVDETFHRLLREASQVRQEQPMRFFGNLRTGDTLAHLAANTGNGWIFRCVLDAGFGDDLDKTNLAGQKPGQGACADILAVIRDYRASQDTIRPPVMRNRKIVAGLDPRK